MQLPDAMSFAGVLSERFGIQFTCHRERDADGVTCVRVSPVDLDDTQGFSIYAIPGWRSLTVEFRPGSFAGPLIRAMGLAFESGYSSFCRLNETMAHAGAEVDLRVNGELTKAEEATSGSGEWRTFEYRVKYLPVYIEDEGDIDTQWIEYLGPFIAAILLLIPTEERPNAVGLTAEAGLPEGAKLRVEVNRYERSVLNRAACIEIHGISCMACNFDFELTYGEVGKGFIHVHHITPVSQLTEGYRIDPTRDLIPLCPNCHALVHRRDPPYSLEDVQRFLASVSSNGT